MTLFRIAYVFDVPAHADLPWPHGAPVRVEVMAYAEGQPAAQQLCREEVAAVPGHRFMHFESIEPLIIPKLIEVSRSRCPN